MIHAIAALLKKYHNKHLDIEVNGEFTTLSLFDWSDLKEWELDDGRHASDLIYEYFLSRSDDAVKKVKKGDWIPFGVLGLYPGAGKYDAKDFAEMHHRGIVLLDVSAPADDPAVLFFHEPTNSTPVQISASLSALPLRLHKEEK